MLANKPSSIDEPNDSRQNVVVVGGGPAGFAAALMLAKRGWTNIAVLEKRPAADYYEPDKSFNYSLDGRGQKMTDLLGLTQQLSEISVPSTEFYLTVIKPNGSRKTLKLPTVDSNRKAAYWLPRKAFVRLLYQAIEQNWQDQITVLFNTECVQINQITNDSEPEGRLEVVAQSENGGTRKFEPHLLLGCDGLHSIVRNTLKDWDSSTSDGTSGKFEMQQFPSPSSGLRYKVLILPPNFPLDHNGEEHAINDRSYAIRGIFKHHQRSLSLGLLPLKNPDASRTANVIRKPDHEVWELKTGEEVSNFFAKAFPQLPIDQIVSPAEADRFAKSEGGAFPPPQHCSGFYSLLKPAPAENKQPQVGIVLLGDAIHCFPPDIGQGVNSALEDVLVLHEALAKSEDNLAQALPLYESLRVPDVKALVRLAQVAYPWQYNQDRFGKALWSINFFLRLLLSRLLPFLFSPPAFFLTQNYQLSYQRILELTQRTTFALYGLGLVMVGGLLALLFYLNDF